jgi:hypothetical protein
MQLTQNFEFLANHDAELVKLGGLAERYFRDDPSIALVKLRQFAELLAKLIAARHALYAGERETFEETLRRLSYERIVPREAADLFHALRKYGNAAVHEARGTHADALSGLRFARQLGIWFHRTTARSQISNRAHSCHRLSRLMRRRLFGPRSPRFRASSRLRATLSPLHVARPRNMPAPARASNSG